MERKTFTKQRDMTNSKVRQLQQRWQELNEREMRAQQHNKELLQQFEEAEETLKEMLACTAAMKTIRMEYEQYLKESSQHWQQQLKEKTQAAQRRNTKEAEVTKACADQCSQGSIKKPQDVAEAQNKDDQRNIHSDYNQHGSSYHPYVQTSWLTHPLSQSAEFLMRASHQPQGSSHVLPSFLPHLTPTPSHHPWPRQTAPGWCSLQTDCPWSWTAGTAGLPESLWGQLYNKEPLPDLMASQAVAQRPETSGASGSKSERCGGRRTSHLSQELDVKPVRLSSGQAESSESGRDSSQAIRERRKKRGRSRCTSSEKSSHSSEESSRSSSAVVTASAAVSQGSETGARKCNIKASKKTRQRSGARVAEPLRLEKVLKDNNRNKGHESVSQFASRESGRQAEESTGENTGNSSADEKSEECREESGSLSIQLKSKTGDEKQKQEIISSEPSSSEEKGEDDKPEIDVGESNAEEKEKSQEDEYQDGDVEEETDPEEKDNSLKEEQDTEEEVGDGEVSAERQTTDEEETGAEDEMEEQDCEVKDELKNDNCDKRRSASSRDEDESEQEAETEDEEESDEEEHGESEEEQLSDKEREPEEESHLGDGANSPKKNRAERRHVSPEEAAENDNDKTGNKTGFTDDENFSEDDDIENLLAPEEQGKKRPDKDLNAAEKPKVSDMKIFQVDDDRSTQITPQHSDSDAFDHFYD